QLYFHCDTLRIIPDQQFGFRKRSNCETALLKATDSWITKVDAGLFVGALLIDLSKTFDTVPHSSLLAELAKIGCNAITLDWFTSYLTSRSQRVTHRGYSTPWMPVS